VAGSTGAVHSNIKVRKNLFENRHNILYDMFLLVSARASAVSCKPVVSDVNCQAPGVMMLSEALLYL